MISILIIDCDQVNAAIASIIPRCTFSATYGQYVFSGLAPRHNPLSIGADQRGSGTCLQESYGVFGSGFSGELEISCESVFATIAESIISSRKAGSQGVIISSFLSSEPGCADLMRASLCPKVSNSSRVLPLRWLSFHLRVPIVGYSNVKFPDNWLIFICMTYPRIDSVVVVVSDENVAVAILFPDLGKP